MTSYGVLADLILVVHAGYALFVVGGQLLIVAGWVRGWGWTRAPAFRFTHLLAILIVVAQAWLGEACPLTVWEDALRRVAGEEGYETGFVRYWTGRLLFYSAPPWVFTLAYTAFAAAVAACLYFYPPKRRRVAKRRHGS